MTATAVPFHCNTANQIPKASHQFIANKLRLMIITWKLFGTIGSTGSEMPYFNHW
jgi:hypothetical protein